MKYRTIISAILLGVFSVLIAMTSVLRDLDYRLADSMYQTGGKYSDKILIIGIDNYALSEFGTWPWSRDVMADVLYAITSDEENMPAAIGVDVIYAGESDPEIDEYLVESASQTDNIVFATSVEFTTQMVMDEDEDVYMDQYYVASVNYPFTDLRENAEIGHTNAMYDIDGVLRHHLWSIETEDETILSMPYKLYELYCDYWNLEADFMPTISDDGFWWVDFGGKPEDMYAYSVADIIYGDYDPEQLKGSVVLIGPYEPGMLDNFLTSSDRAANMYGIEYIGNVVDAMIRGANKIEISNFVHYVIIFIIAAGMLILLNKVSIRGSIFVSILAVLGIFFGSIYLYNVGWVIRPLIFFIAVILAFVANIVEHYILERIEKKKVLNTFQHYVDPSIIKELMESGEDALNLGGKNMDIAVLFVDIRGFTTMSERMTPREVVNMLNEYLTLTSQCIKNHGGTLDKFVGDCTMAFWGAPLECEEPEYKACKAAMEMVERGRIVGARLTEKYGSEISFGVGVHYGPAVVGNIGAVNIMDYTAIGDTVNTSARLEANAPAGTVYISRIVADALGDRAKTTSLGYSVKLKGKSEFEVLILDELI